MRNPNGYGGISYLGENRRNPFRARITTGWEYNENTGRQKQKYATLGYYPTRKAAMIALAKYNENPYDLDVNKVTFEDMYIKYVNTEDITEGMKKSYKSAFAKLEPLHHMKMADIKKKHLQDALDANAGLSTVYLEKIRSLIKNIWQYCIDNDLIEKDYTKKLRISPNDKKTGIHTPFTEDEIQLLWDNVDMPIDLRLSRRGNETIKVFYVDTVLMLIYTGMRPSELLNIECENINLKERYMIGGMKNEAGKNRIIPIHDDIFPLIEARVNKGTKYLIPYKVELPPDLSAYRYVIFDPIMDKLKIEHLPHDGRHTFSTVADNYLDIDIKKRIMGHTIKDITQGTYTHKTAADLVKEVNKIIFLKK
ncbi:MAG: tyrosine-type recombinase/integrase [Lachnospiraceae bacterium]